MMKNPNNVDWSLLQSFVAVSEHGSFSAAARATNGSQATLSRHISALEQQLDTRLFDRAIGGVEMTKNGIEILRHVTDMADAAGRLSLAAEGHDQAISGTVRVTAPNTVAAYLLPEIISALRIAEPEIVVELVASNKTENLLRREADIAVRMVDPTQDDLFARKVGESGFGLYAAKSYLERHPAPKTAQDIFDHDVIGFDTNERLITGFSRFGLEVDRDFFAFRCDNQVVCWNMVLAGFGLSINQREIGDAEPLVSLIDLPNTMARFPVWIVAHSELKTNLRVRRVFDFLAEEVAKVTD